VGVAAAFAMAQAAFEASGAEGLSRARALVEGTRPTAQNLFHATARVFEAALRSPQDALAEALAIADEDARMSQSIGELAQELIPREARVLTHCNAGWLAFTDHGTALAPIYRAQALGKNPFVYVDETRPRGQGARLTAWELGQQGVPHQLIADNAAALLMAQGLVDLVIVGADRVAANGDVANKIGTLEKALAAKYFGIPFYVAAPTSTLDMLCPDGKAIPIEYRSEDELLWQSGPDADGQWHTVRVAAPGTPALNPAFDVTPAALVTAIITEKGIFAPQQMDQAAR